MKKELTYKEIGEILDKSENTIKGWKQKFPKLLELVKIGAFCEANGLNEDKIVKMVEIQEMIRGRE